MCSWDNNGDQRVAIRIKGDDQGKQFLQLLDYSLNFTGKEEEENSSSKG